MLGYICESCSFVLMILKHRIIVFNDYPAVFWVVGGRTGVQSIPGARPSDVCIHATVGVHCYNQQSCELPFISLCLF